MDTLMSELNSNVHLDNNILFEIHNLLRKQNSLRTIDNDSFSVSVENGVVYLTGHLIRASNRKLIEDVVRFVPGVVAVNNNLILDSDLTIQVARALAGDKHTCPLIFPVTCFQGWIYLGGEVPTEELQLAAEKVAGQVSSVRGVVTLPQVTCKSTSTRHRAIQPRIQAKVYDYNLNEGVVTQVVIQPRNRLVTHAVVRVNHPDNKDVLIPTDAMDITDKENILLKQNEPHLNTFPIFESSDYPLAPFDWQPPYPYIAGDVRWQRA